MNAKRIRARRNPRARIIGARRVLIIINIRGIPRIEAGSEMEAWASIRGSLFQKSNPIYRIIAEHVDYFLVVVQVLPY